MIVHCAVSLEILLVAWLVFAQKSPIRGTIIFKGEKVVSRIYVSTFKRLQVLT